MYVVYYRENLRDGVEEGAKIVSTLDEAMAEVNRFANSFIGSNMSFRLFGLGKEIPLVAEEVEEPQPVKTSVRFYIPQGKSGKYGRKGE